ncbi:MAG: TIGR04084 family radical SAM/SPASM domain-containing protein [Methanoregulaceae archaeon]|nr:TIGR04084 family radical SAM/SPASM domain-containing protein [Methanoregulaceae archaeon]
MFFHIILTDECNLCCRYCRGNEPGVFLPLDEDCGIDMNLPVELAYDLTDLYSFLARDPTPCITFYGGEPLIRADLIREIMDGAPAASRFMVQTNGLLLDAVDQEYLNRMETILVSIDGQEDLTDYYRGNGTYRKVISQVNALLNKGYPGEVIARMTVTRKTDIKAAVHHLAFNHECPFSSIHWQIDADFSGNPRIIDFGRWLERSYKPGIRRLIGDWVRTMEEEDRVARWYPFLQTTEDLLLRRSSRLRCGSGYSNYTVMTDGHIGPCPVMTGMRDFYIGHIQTADPLSLPVVGVGGSCPDCEIFGFCGGRCLYASATRPWSPEQKELICSAVKALFHDLTDVLPRIRTCIESGGIELADFSHTRYNGCEIIP